MPDERDARHIRDFPPELASLPHPSSTSNNQMHNALPGISLSEIRTSLRATTFLRRVIWLGLAYGLIEGLISMTLSFFPGILTWHNANSAPIIFVAPVVYAALFLLISLPLGWVVGRRPIVERWWLAGLAMVAGFCLAELDGRVFSTKVSLFVALAIGVQCFRALASPAGRLHHFMDRTMPALVGVVVFVGFGIVGGNWLRENWALSRLPPIDGQHPNVVLLVMDTERADHLSAYGYSRLTTPRLDSLARRSTLFENAYSAGPWTLPSHSSMMTGRAVREHGAGTVTPWSLDDLYPTIAEAMRHTGYATGGFVSNLYWTGRSTGLNRGFLHYDDYFGNPADAVNRTVAGRLLVFPALAEIFHLTDIPGRRRAPEINHQLLTWIDHLDGRPFFAFLNYNDVHQPYLPPPSTAGKFGSVRDVKKVSSLHIGAWDEDKSVPPPALLNNGIARYDESLFAMDSAIGTLEDELQRRGMLDNTLLIVVADHGEAFGEHGLMGHGQSLVAAETHVPLLIKEPGNRDGGRRISKPITTTDLPVTIAGIVGLAPPLFPGRTLLSDDPGRMGPVLSEVRSRFRPEGFRTVEVDEAESLREGEWQFIHHQSGATELFSKKRDPGETIDYADSTAYRNVVKHFKRKLQELPEERR